MKYASVCSGIEAASVAWEPLGWQAAWFAEIEKFPSAVLEYHFQHVPNLGDMTKIKGDEHGAIDLLVGGTPCQDLSIAGKRMGFGGKRSVLALDFVRLAYESGAKWFVWENVPGVFSSNGGEDFAQLLSLFAGWQVDTPADGWGSFGIVEQSPGCFGLAWRVIDVQYARVDGFPNAIPQRRNRVFVVGYLGDWRRAAQVLFEPEGLLGDTPPRREARKGAAGGAGGRATLSGKDVFPTIQANCGSKQWLGNQECFSGDYFISSRVFDARGNGDGVTCPTVTGDHAGRPTDYTPVVCSQVAPTLDCSYATKQGLDNQHIDGGAGLFVQTVPCGMKQQAQIVAVADVIHGDKACNGKGWNDDGSAYTLDTMATQGVCCPSVAFERRFVRTTGWQPTVGVNPCLRADMNGGDGAPCVAFTTDHSVCSSAQVRRLTPTECERLMGFPDGWTRIPWRGKPAEGCPDGPRYKACGNSMGVNVMRWIGIRIQEVESKATV